MRTGLLSKLAIATARSRRPIATTASPIGRYRPNEMYPVGDRRTIDFVEAGESESRHTNDFQYHIDVGVRVFVTRNAGISTEFRVVLIPDVNFYRMLVVAVFRVD